MSDKHKPDKVERRDDENAAGILSEVDPKSLREAGLTGNQEQCLYSLRDRLDAITWISGRPYEEFTHPQKVDAVARMATDHRLADAISSVIQGVQKQPIFNHDNHKYSDARKSAHKLTVQAVHRILNNHAPTPRFDIDDNRSCC